jgi:peroxiredoxin
MRVGRSVLAAAVLVAATTAAWAVDVGDKAPDLDVASWVQGEPVTLEQLAGKKAVLLEFCSSTSEPCKKALPKLAKLAEKDRDALEVIVVSDESAELLKAFAESGKFTGRVACDSERNTSGPYLQGSRGKLPYAVVLDKTGAVVWKGEPGTTLPRVVQRVVAGTLDGEKAKKIAELQTTVDEGVMLKNFGQASADADKLLEADPSNEKGITAKLRYLQNEKESAKAKAFVEQILPRIDDAPGALNLVAWELATHENLAMRHPALALRAARRAVEKSEGADGAILDTLARAQHECGLDEQAIETQTKAVAVPDTDEKELEKMKAALAYYVACAEAKKSEGK